MVIIWSFVRVIIIVVIYEFGTAGLPDANRSNKPVATPAAHFLVTNQHRVPTQHYYQPNSYRNPVKLVSND